MVPLAGQTCKSHCTFDTVHKLPAPLLTSNAHECAVGTAKHSRGAFRQRLMRGVQQQALLRVHGQGLCAHHSKQLAVKQLDLREEHAKLQGRKGGGWICKVS